MSLLVRTCFALFLLLVASHARAEFFIWFDELGYKHVSNLPRECITEHKTVNPICRSLVPDGTGGRPERSVAAMALQARAGSEESNGNLYLNTAKGLKKPDPKNFGETYAYGQASLGLALAALKAEREDKIRQEYLKAGVRPPDKIVVRPSLQQQEAQQQMADDIQDIKREVEDAAFKRRMGMDY